MRDRVDRGMFVFAVPPRRAAQASAVAAAIAVLALFGGFHSAALAAGGVAFLCFVVAAVRMSDEAQMDRPEPAEQDRRCPSCGADLPAGAERVIIRGEAYCNEQRCASVAW